MDCMMVLWDWPKNVPDPEDLREKTNKITDLLWGLYIILPLCYNLGSKYEVCVYKL